MRTEETRETIAALERIEDAAKELVARMMPLVDEVNPMRQCKFCYELHPQLPNSHDLVGGKPCPVGELERAIAAAN